jgi:phage-related minor tail protein
MVEIANKIALLRLIREQVTPNESGSFSLKASAGEDVAPQSTLVAQAERPSARQKEQACVSLLNEARRAIDSILEPFSDMSAQDLASLLKNPNSRKLLHNNLDVASAKLAAVRDQCGDVLPAGAMEEIAELEEKLNRVRDILGKEGQTSPDLLAIVGDVLEIVGNGLGTVAGIVMIMMRLIFSPVLPQTQTGGGSLLAQGKAGDGMLQSPMQRN